MSSRILSLVSRRRGRGAAMVEAAVVLPVLIAFLGLTMMMKQAYASKLTSNQQIRSQVLDYASHNCKEQKISYSGNTQGSGTGLNAGATGSSNSTASGALGQSGGGATASGFMAKAEVSYAAKTITNPKPNTATRGTGLTLRVNGEKSTALCNEEAKDGNLSGLFSYATSAIRL